MKQERIQNPSSVERAVIESKIAEGCHVILQFDGPRYTPELLRKINNLCGELGQDLEVRFYGHKFDASHLRFLPDVAALSVDCLLEATNLSALNDLANLRRLSLGIYRLDGSPAVAALWHGRSSKKSSTATQLHRRFHFPALRFDSSENSAKLPIHRSGFREKAAFSRQIKMAALCRRAATSVLLESLSEMISFCSVTRRSVPS